MRIRDWINRGVGFGLLLSLLLCIAGAALGALLMDKEILSVESQGVWIAAVWLMAAFSGSRLAHRNTQEGRLLHAAVQALILYFIVWGAALAASAVPNFQANGWYITGCIWGGTIMAAILPAGRKRRKRKVSARKKYKR